MSIDVKDFGDTDKKLIEKLSKRGAFDPILDIPVDMNRINIDVMSRWVGERLTELLGFEDEVVEGLMRLLTGTDPFSGQLTKVDPKALQVQLTGFLEKQAAPFVTELWKLLSEAQDAPCGVAEFRQNKTVRSQLRSRGRAASYRHGRGKKRSESGHEHRTQGGELQDSRQDGRSRHDRARQKSDDDNDRGDRRRRRQGEQDTTRPRRREDDDDDDDEKQRLRGARRRSTDEGDNRRETKQRRRNGGNERPSTQHRLNDDESHLSRREPARRAPSSGSKSLPPQRDALPKGWEWRESRSQAGSWYCYNVDTGEKRWDPPTTQSVSVSHILVKHADSKRPFSWRDPHIDVSKAAAREELFAIRQTIEASPDQLAELAKIARVRSDCPSAHKGGELKSFSKGELDRAFEGAAFSLQPGALSPIVDTPTGLHLIYRRA